MRLAIREVFAQPTTREICTITFIKWGVVKVVISANGKIGILPRNFPQELGRVPGSSVVNVAQPTTREICRITCIKRETAKVVYLQME